MVTLLLVRHGRSQANSSGVLAGRSPGNLLDDAGEEQARAVGERMARLPVTTVVSSPLERCQQTAVAVAEALAGDLQVHTDERIVECGYGDWTGRELKGLAKEPLWKVVQSHPSAAAFPGGESLRDMQQRGIEAVRDWNHRIAESDGPDALWVAVSHGDVIKAILADALGLHLDLFQRIVVDPASVSVVSYTDLRPFVVRLNDLGSLDALIPKKRRRRRRAAGSDAVVGGGAGA